MFASRMLATIFLMALIILFTRLLPFLFFRGKDPPGILNYLERNIPPLIVLLLILYCLKDAHWVSAPYACPELGAIAVVIMMHLWRNNALLSIVSGTATYMFIIKALTST
jgi:branched-subunit amino acid transport protein AzlD